MITRAGPARILGLEHKGHLGAGADADITVYTPDDNYETMFAWPYMVFKNGQLIMSEGEFRSTTSGKLLDAKPSYDSEHDKSIEKWFEKNYSIPLNPI